MRLIDGTFCRRCGAQEVWGTGGVGHRRCGAQEVWGTGGMGHRRRKPQPTFCSYQCEVLVSLRHT